MFPRQSRPWLVPFFLFLNIAIFAYWQMGDDSRQSFLQANFTVSWVNLVEGRYWTLLSSVFSHNMLLHLLVNMVVLNSFGSVLEEDLGWWWFLKLYLYCGVMGSLAHSVLSHYVLAVPEQGALGASGALAGLVLVFSLLYPTEKILIFGIIPLPAWFGALVFIGLDLWGLWVQAKGGGLPIGHGAHLGGAFAGIYYYFSSLRPRVRRI